MLKPITYKDHESLICCGWICGQTAASRVYKGVALRIDTSGAWSANDGRAPHSGHEPGGIIMAALEANNVAYRLTET